MNTGAFCDCKKCEENHSKRVTFAADCMKTCKACDCIEAHIIRHAVFDLFSNLKEKLGNGKLTPKLLSEILYWIGNEIGDIPRIDCDDPPFETSVDAWRRFFFGKDPEKTWHNFPEELDQGNVIDHVLTYRNKFVFEPYNFGLEGCKAIVEVAEKYGLDVFVSGRARHLPAFCVRVEFLKPKVAKEAMER